MKQILQENQHLAVMKIARSAPLFVAVAGIGALLAYMLWPAQENQGGPELTPVAGWQQASVANPFGKAAPDAQQPSQPLAGALPSPWSLANTSLAGTQADGDWGVDARGQFKASRELRRRFDYYLSLIGEIPLVDIHALVLHHAKQSLQEPALGHVMAHWDQYVKLQQHAWKHAVDLRQPSSWGVALSERQIVRRHILGADVAYAYYSEEEEQLQQMMMQAQSGQSTRETAPVPASVALHPDSRDREAAVQLQWQQWEQRLSMARSKLGQLRQAPELSALQRQQAIESYLESQFQGDELTRARALLGI